MGRLTILLDFVAKRDRGPTPIPRAINLDQMSNLTARPAVFRKGLSPSEPVPIFVLRLYVVAKSEIV